MPHALHGMIVDVELVGYHPGAVQAGFVHGESVVLTRDVNPSLVRDGLVASAVTELHLVCPSAERECGYLIP